jgi:hypothetical protein
LTGQFLEFDRYRELKHRSRDAAREVGPGSSIAAPKVRDEALYGLAGDVVRAISPHSEGHLFAILAQFLICFGNACGRGPGFRVGLGTRHHLNLFGVAVGDTATARKGTSLADAQEIVRRAEPTWRGVRQSRSRAAKDSCGLFVTRFIRRSR